MEVLPVRQQAGDRSLRHCLHPKRGQRAQLVYPLDDEGLPWLHMGEGEEMKTVIEMARIAGVRDDGHRFEFSEYEHFLRFVELVRAETVTKEREACAKVCEEVGEESDSFTRDILRSTAATIRARSNT